MLRAAAVVLAVLCPAYACAQSSPHHHNAPTPRAHATVAPTQPGQGAFAAIQEIVDILEADPRTDWSKVDIGALRQHLEDMDNVTLHAQVRSTPIGGGLTRATLTGAGWRELLTISGCFDVEDPRFDVGKIAATTLHHVPVWIAPTGDATCEVYLANSYAPTLHELWSRSATGQGGPS